MTNKQREQIRAKFGGLCTYSGKPLDDKWQIDHVIPVYYYKMGLAQGDPNHIDNQVPVLRILNHYKRCKDIKEWREYLSTLHLRIAKLPKNPYTGKSIGRKKYLMEVAAAFDITVDNPFCGVFYFEQQTNKTT